MSIDDLQDWAQRTAQELQDFCDEAQEAAGNPDGEDQLASVRALLEEHCRIIKGETAWKAPIGAEDSEAWLVL